MRGEEVDFLTALHQMNSTLLAELMAVQDWDSDQDLFDSYARAHEMRFRSPFEPCATCNCNESTPSPANPHLSLSSLSFAEAETAPEFGDEYRYRLRSDNDQSRIETGCEAAA